MKLVFVSMSVAALLFVSPARAQDANDAAPEKDLAASARAASIELGGKLKARLEVALKDGGPQAALAVCKTAAPGIAADLSDSFGGKVGRTALKVRNPENAPDVFEAAVLKRFVDEVSKGADVSKLEHAEVVDVDGQRMFRYMKAIPMAAAPCAVCHGTAVAPDVLQSIRDLYPDDQATGFKPGEIRGAFTVVKPLR
ncbi:MAG: DUF3365 domain-containing protein [Rhizobiales bacterium]|nr:DUF3365 domain-containing protein [Hyphomicrobiales bacterium]